MSTLCGNYVAKFSEASHALPQGMHMNADYPFMLPSIAKSDGKTVTLKSDRNGQEVTLKIKTRMGREYCVLEQSSSFELICTRPPHKFRFEPFKDQLTELLENRP